MVFHLAGFYEVVPANQVDYEINTVADDVLSRSGDKRFVVPNDLNQLAFAVKKGGDAVRLFTPSAEATRTKLYIFETDIAKGAVNERTINLVATEELSAYVTNSNPSNSVPVLVGVGFGVLEETPLDNAVTLKAYGTVNAQAGEWTTVKLTPELSLPAGQYTVVGAIPVIKGLSDLALLRFIFPGQLWRPGTIVVPDENIEAIPKQKGYLVGRGLVFGSFTHNTFPDVQVLTRTDITNAQLEVTLYIVRA